MLTCLPQSICSWDFQVLDRAGAESIVEFNFLTEQGRIAIDGEEYTVRKHGMMSGHWTLEYRGRIQVEARKPNAFFRRFELAADGESYEVQSMSMFSRAFEIMHHGRQKGTIRTAHMFTRRAFIECDTSVPQQVQLFAFWLAVLTWKRGANNNNST